MLAQGGVLNIGVGQHLRQGQASARTFRVSSNADSACLAQSEQGIDGG